MRAEPRPVVEDLGRIENKQKRIEKYM